ncbi:hypothetical protein P7K49_034278, partial [Saguinus oedipus]
MSFESGWSMAHRIPHRGEGEEAQLQQDGALSQQALLASSLPTAKCPCPESPDPVGTEGWGALPLLLTSPLVPHTEKGEAGHVSCIGPKTAAESLPVG